MQTMSSSHFALLFSISKSNKNFKQHKFVSKPNSSYFVTVIWLWQCTHQLRSCSPTFIADMCWCLRCFVCLSGFAGKYCIKTTIKLFSVADRFRVAVGCLIKASWPFYTEISSYYPSQHILNANFKWEDWTKNIIISSLCVGKNEI